MKQYPIAGPLPSYVIEAQNITKYFGSHEALKGLSFQVRSGECLGLLGSNGAGKSTLISLLYGLRGPTSGKLRVFGLDPEKQGRSVRQRLGVVPQENALDECLNVMENMLIYAAFMGVPKSERRPRVQDLLRYMLLDHKQDEKISNLSGGMKRRLAFVRALLANPDLIILDEPTTGLDPAVRHLLWNKVKEQKELGKTVLLTTHYIHEAEVLCDRVLVMNSGSIVAEGSPKDLIQHHSPGFLAIFDPSGFNEELQAQASHRGLRFSKNSSAAYLHSLEIEDLVSFQKETRQTALQIRPSNLEDVFLKLSGQEILKDD